MEGQKENKNSGYEYTETRLSKWLFRLFFLFATIFACCLAIHLEFKSMKKNENVRADAMKMTGHLSKTFEDLRGAWDVMFYFYKAGELFRIIRCPDVSPKKGAVQHNTLLSFYREQIEGKDDNEDEEDSNFNRELYKAWCGERITINIGFKSELYKHPDDYKSYMFKLGEEPIELIEKYPFVKDALNKMAIGERTTFVAIPTENNILRPKKHTMYEITMHLNSNEIARRAMPLYSVIKEGENKNLIDEHVNCGSVVSFIYEIYSPMGKLIKTEQEVKKVRVGSGELGEGLEQILTKMSVGDRYKVFITKNDVKKSDNFAGKRQDQQNNDTGGIITSDLFKDNDVVVFDIRVVNLQK